MSLKKYFQDVRSELKRVTWPSFDEVNRAVGAVLGLFFIVGIFVAIVDGLMVALWKLFHLGPYKVINNAGETAPPVNTSTTTGTSTP